MLQTPIAGVAEAEVFGVGQYFDLRIALSCLLQWLAAWPVVNDDDVDGCVTVFEQRCQAVAEGVSVKVRDYDGNRIHSALKAEFRLSRAHRLTAGPIAS